MKIESIIFIMLYVLISCIPSNNEETNKTYSPNNVEERIESFFKNPINNFTLPSEIIDDNNDVESLYDYEIRVSNNKYGNNVLSFIGKNWSANYIPYLNRFKRKALFFNMEEYNFGIKVGMTTEEIINTFGIKYERPLLKNWYGISYKVKNTNNYIVFCFDNEYFKLCEVRLIYNE
jgi:hypothetical protein